VSRRNRKSGAAPKLLNIGSVLDCALDKKHGDHHDRVIVALTHAIVELTKAVNELALAASQSKSVQAVSHIEVKDG
jgi:hypothetical protein